MFIFLPCIVILYILPFTYRVQTLPEKEYISLMCQKGVDEGTSAAHHQRMSKMKDAFISKEGDNLGIFGAVDVGDQACWWDYGQLKLYSTNNIKLIDNDKVRFA